MPSRLFRISIPALIAVLLIAGFVWHRINLILSPVSSQNQEIIVTIPSGASMTRIAKILEEAGAIRSAAAFRYLAAWKGRDRSLRAGEHVLNRSMSTPQVLQSLISGPLKLYKLTVPEGLTMVQIATLAEEQGLAAREDFLTVCRDRDFIKSQGLDADSLEGYLFPETYHFAAGAAPKDIVRALVERFGAVWDRYQNLAAGSGLTRHQIVTLASIVEKETAVASERPLIAAVFLNRLKRGIPLQSDPTVIYGLKDFNGNLTRKHLETYTPYNTYQIVGLPPGPVANPGEASLKAVLEPADKPYLYFVSKNDGTHHFSRTLGEHTQAVNRYQRNSRRR